MQLKNSIFGVVLLAFGALSRPCWGADTGGGDTARAFLFGYGSGNISFGLDDDYEPYSASRENDFGTFYQFWGEPLDKFVLVALDSPLLPDRIDAGDGWESYLRAGLGSLGYQQRSLATGGRLGQSHWYAAIALDNQTRDGYSDNLFLKTKAWSAHDVQFSRFRVGYAGEDFTAELQLTAAHQRLGDDGIFLTPLPRRVSLSNTRGYNKDSQKHGQINLEWQIGSAWKLSSLSQYLARDGAQLQDIDRTPLNTEVFHYQRTGERWSEKLRLEYLHQDGSVTALESEYLTDKSRDGSVTRGLLLAPLSDQVVTLALLADQDTQRWQSKIEQDFLISDSTYLSLDVGFTRYQFDRIQEDIASIGGIVAGGGRRNIDRVAETFNRATPQLFFSQQLDASWSLSFDASQRYKPGGVSYNLVSGVRRPYQEEIEHRYRLAITREFDQIWALDVGIFNSDFNALQVPIYGRRDNPFDIGIVNAQSATSQGFDFNGQLVLGQAWSINFDGRFENTRFSGLPAALNGFSGNEFIYAPKVRASLKLTWHATDRNSLSIEELHQSAQFSDLQNTAEDQIDGFNLTNLAWVYERTTWSLVLWGANVTDETFLTYKSFSSNLAVAGLGRTFGATLEARF